jgi:hypothetical protein
LPPRQAVEERVVSRSTFVKLIESTKAWRAFTGKTSKKAPPTGARERAFAVLLTWTETADGGGAYVDPVGPLLVPSSEAPPHGVEAPRRLRRAEHSTLLPSSDAHLEPELTRCLWAGPVLSQRTGRILLVLERCIDNLNQHAILRTAECLG